MKEELGGGERLPSPNTQKVQILTGYYACINLVKINKTL